MANENVCVFCGEKMGFFHAMTVTCAGYYLSCCKSCYKELKNLSEEEQCRRALRLGLVQNTQALEAYIEQAVKAVEVADHAEEHRPTCSQCGNKLRFQRVQYLDNSPMRDSLFSATLAVLPAVCPSCGKYEFYDPEIAEKNEYLALLMKKDSAEKL
jgi:hypothetical protein